ncbi:MAG: sigma-70 family RNA polymerase sigma factor [Oscillospiraceae bacterium]|nr:sigma-70 family RNA polymerase sigma factor [Oscillospiraceae bacterium]
MRDAIEEIYQTYAGDVYRFALGLCGDPILAEDILQDTMLRAIEHFDQFEGRCTVKTWLCTIARNLWLNHCSRSEQKNLPLDEALQVENGDPIEQRVSDRLQAKEIHRLLHDLDEPYKEIFTLRIFAELPFGEIGALFGKSANWARVTYFRAKEKLLDKMEQEGLL